ncbi:MULTISPECIES: GNAT family N-acetyltransferase [unclassified Exiguobacterium]|uniref:GNAT family N-acetyltransferase n=1 Tax=unclassified Exiguobacterium TaxID=2644629 RepID=UPI00103CE738|nr:MULTISPECIES: GNAT family protein [unclassified Exiguobacterium]TCI36366.1 N-acetyltransferase [Exiguobacterium sp. SH4S7]TCI48414.1 N-acetyltransferase [Exiguobacterium sp. SH5S32]TCI55303.1 N-acetyltransferase [Exiguobacterium sp. SH1S4]TCI75095.1 N-acetyltransferase [Exiguobacterium sp. SH1S1]TCI78024.1 N-acetyltransferase [Exiguobacterium sp. SH0S1]
MYRDENLIIRPIEARDLGRLWELIYKEAAPEWKRWDAPYFEHRAQSYDAYQEEADRHVGRDDMWVVEVDGTVFGTVSYYYEDAGKEWLEVGIILHQSDRWNQGVGTRALKLWIDHLFNTLSTVRVGLTTWSGNERMVRVAEKIGMQLEGRMRRVRVVRGERYDSIRMGMLREEWEDEQKRDVSS